MATLLSHEIKTIVDVRELPLSRKKGFSKAALSAELANAGISYIHLKGLGDPKVGRNAAKSGDFLTFRSVFNAHFGGSLAQKEFETLLEVASTGRTCMLCFEKCPINCHRAIIAMSAEDRGFDIVNLVSGEMAKRISFVRKVISNGHSESLSAAE